MRQLIEMNKDIAARVEELEGGSQPHGWGWAGAWVGATTFMALGALTLTIPVVGEVTETTCALAGAIAGFLGFGYVGDKLGEEAGKNLWQLKRTYWQ